MRLECDTIIRRYQRITVEVAVLERTGKTFAKVVANAGVETCALVSTGTMQTPTLLTHGKRGVIRGHVRDA